MASYKCVLCGKEGTKDEIYCNKCGGRVMKDTRPNQNEVKEIEK